jgi:DNA-binding response OmpR family regulator
MESLKVLVIDDDETTCNLLETVLQMENYRTASASKIENGDIIALLNNEKPDILILDFHLGSIETIGYVNAIRANADWQHLPIMMTSAIDRHQECLAAGGNVFMLKPFDWQEMITSIKKMSDNLI